MGLYVGRVNDALGNELPCVNDMRGLTVPPRQKNSGKSHANYHRDMGSLHRMSGRF